MIKKIFLLLFSLVIVSCNLKPRIISREIVSAYNDKELSGGFFLFVASIGEYEYYYFFVKRLDNGLEKIKLRTDDIIIYEGNHKPHIEYYSLYEFEREFFICDASTTKRGIAKIKLYVPENTIIKKFEIK